MSKVLIVRSGPYPVNINGYNDQFIGLARAFAKKGIKSDIIFYSKNKESNILIESNPEIVVHNIRGIRILRTGIYPQLLKKSFLKKYDLVITTEYSQIMTVLLGIFSEAPVILYTGPYYNLFKIPCMSAIYDFLFTKTINRHMDKIISKSELATKYLEKKGYSSVKTLGVGQDIKRFQETSHMDENVSKIINEMKKTRTILTVGSIDSRKNYFFTLLVFKKLLTKDPDFQLLIIGNGNDRYIKKGLKMLSKEERKKVKFGGRIDNQQLKYVYPNAFAFLLPSKLEIFGMVLLEAMYFKCPVVSSINGGSTTMIEDGINGYIRNINEDDIEEWVNVLIKLNDKETRKKIIGCARNTIQNEFSWDKLADSFLN
ncbi:hypothetical protein BTM29_05020 [Companilactobacillus allii]|uniref:Glycosyl transferase family 1 domain-containing protein n=1 Tax=Companilactobacillus allii TaxID=1847728 RepID=A0A1P8Q669_9LACO|nr:hypothetical protein BTM29_05020 [Companilactobacillus allii]